MLAAGKTLPSLPNSLIPLPSNSSASYLPFQSIDLLNSSVAALRWLQSYSANQRVLLPGVGYQILDTCCNKTVPLGLIYFPVSASVSYVKTSRHLFICLLVIFALSLLERPHRSSCSSQIFHEW